MKKYSILAIVFFVAITSGITAQLTEVRPLANSVDAKSAAEAVAKSKDLEFKGRQAYNEGYYAEAEQYAIDAKAYAQLAAEWYKANGYLRRAEDRLKIARQYKIDSSDSELFARADDAFKNATITYNNKIFSDSVTYSMQVIDLLKDIKAPMTAKSAEPVKPAESAKPTTYTVRKLPKADCFWRISGYDFIYNDPTKWRRIYEANKHILQNPNNPDLIQPGMVFTIPRP